MFTSSVKKCLKFLQLVDRDQFSSCKKYARNCNSARLTMRDFGAVYETLIDRLSAIIYSLNAIK